MAIRHLKPICLCFTTCNKVNLVTLTQGVQSPDFCQVTVISEDAKAIEILSYKSDHSFRLF